MSCLLVGGRDVLEQIGARKLEVAVAQLDEAPLLVAQARGVLGAELGRGGRVGGFLLAEARDRRGLDDDRRVHRGRGRRRLHADRRELLGLRVDGRASSCLRFGRDALDGRDLGDDRRHRGALRIDDLLGHAARLADADAFALLRGHRLRDRLAVHGRAPRATTRRPSGSSRRVRLGGVNLDRLALAVGVDVVVSLSGSRRLRRSSRSSFSGNAARITRQDARAPTTTPRAACRAAHASTTATSRVLTSVISSSATTTVVVAASAAPTLPMKAADSPPSHSPSRPPGPCDEKPLSANGRCSSTATEPSSSSAPPPSRTPSTRRRARKQRTAATSIPATTR